MTTLADVTRRCRRAYAMNHIPWDGAIALLGRHKMLELAQYWEAKAGHSEPVDDTLTLRECVEWIAAVAASVRCAGNTEAHVATARTDRTYHGSYVE